MPFVGIAGGFFALLAIIALGALSKNVSREEFPEGISVARKHETTNSEVNISLGLNVSGWLGLASVVFALSEGIPRYLPLPESAFGRNVVGILYFVLGVAICAVYGIVCVVLHEFAKDNLRYRLFPTRMRSALRNSLEDEERLSEWLRFRDSAALSHPVSKEMKLRNEREKANLNRLISSAYLIENPTSYLNDGSNGVAPSLLDFGLTAETLRQAGLLEIQAERIGYRVFAFVVVAGTVVSALLAVPIVLSKAGDILGAVMLGALAIGMGFGTSFLLGLFLSVLAHPFASFWQWITGASVLVRQRKEYLAAQSKYSAIEKQRIEEEQERQLRAEHERRCREANYWFGLDGHQFEHEMAKLWRSLGHEAKVTPRSGDEGVDVVLVMYGERIAVQCKAHQAPQSPSVVRELLGAAHAGKFDRAILVSLAGVTSGAMTFANTNGIEVMDVDDVLRLNAQAQSLNGKR